MILMKFPWLFVPLSFCFCPLSGAEEFYLAPIIKEGTPGEVLIEDPIVSPLSGGTSLSSGAGSIQNSLQNQMAIPITDYGRAGQLAQIRGFGFSSEDVDVQVLGVSVNPPQGGGFDLSVFPQFLWAGYRFQLGPALNALNQTASTGTLSLVPWTSAALTQSGFGGRAVVFSSSLGVYQVSAAIRSGDRAFEESEDLNRVAVLAGYSTGNAVGPSGSLSSRWGGERYRGSLHLLGTDLDVQTLGSSDAPTPLARTRNIRFVPVIQNDFRVTHRSLLKTSLVYDWGFLGYQDPSMGGSRSQSYFQQWSLQTVYLFDVWKVGVSSRQVAYRSQSTYGASDSSFQTPLQNVGNLQVSREMEWGGAMVVPTFQGIWVTNYGFLPEGSLGVRSEWGNGAQVSQALFGRASFSRRTPTLLDRFATFVDFVGNPDLQTETDWTGQVGAERRGQKVEGNAQAYVQLKQNARVYTGATVNNLNDAFIFALTGTGVVHLMPQMEGTFSATASKSRLILTGYDFPYVPNFLGLAGINVHDSHEKRQWEWTAVARFSSSQVTSAVKGESLPGYFTLDTGFQFTGLPGLRLAVRVENLLDRTIERVRGYPMGRSVSVTLAGEI